MTKFHVHIDASVLAIGTILTHLGDDGMDYPIVYSGRKLNKPKRNYSDMTYPLEELLRDHQEFNWIEECDISFEKLKRKLVEAPILRFPNWSTKFHVYIDSSGLAIGAILTQPGDDGMDYPIAYSSRKTKQI